MSSILGGQFRDNMARVNARADAVDQHTQTLGQSVGKGTNDFSNLLAEAEGRTVSSRNSGALSQKNTATVATETRNLLLTPSDFISNLLPEESAAQLTESMYSSAKGTEYARASLAPGIGLGVKTSDSSVNIPPLITPVRPEPVAPKAPVILSAKLTTSVAATGVTAPTSVKKQTPLSTPTPVLNAIPPKTPPKTPVVKGAQWLKQTGFAKELGPGMRTSQADITEVIYAAGRHHGVDPKLSLAVASAESGLRVGAISNDGHRSKGVFQLLDSTGTEMLDKYGFKDRYDPFNPELNSFLGVGYLKHLHELFSTETTLVGSLKTKPAKSSEHLEKLAVAAYNSGQGTVARAQEKARKMGRDPSDYNNVSPFLPASTRTYVARVTRLKGAFDDVV
jgi:hypothetical protein